MSLRVHSTQTPNLSKINTDVSFGHGFYTPPSSSVHSLAPASKLRKFISEHGMMFALIGPLVLTGLFVMWNLFFNQNQPQP